MYPESTKRQEASNGRRIAGVVDGSCACDVSDRNGVSLAVVDSSEALEQTVEERMMEQRTITVQRISEKESDVFGWMKYLEE